MLTVNNSADPRLQFSRLTCVVLTWLSLGGMAQAAMIDQSQDGIKGNINVGPYDQRIAQTFTPGVDGGLEKVRLRVAYLPSLTSAAPDLVLEIMDTSDGVPNGNVLGTASLAHTAFPDADSLGSAPAPYSDFDFAPVTLRAGTRYALALRAAADTCSLVSCETPAYRVDGVFGVDPYPVGQLFVNSGVVPSFLLDGDLSFQTYMASLAPVPEPGGWLTLIAGLLALAQAGRQRSARTVRST